MLRVLDPAGQAASGIRAFAADGAFRIGLGSSQSNSGLRQVAAGVFSLETVTPGSEVLIKGSNELMPTCRIAPEGNLTVQLTTGIPAELRLYPSGMNELGAYAGELLGIEEAQCGVPVHFFNWSPLASVPGGPSLFMLRNFSRSTSFLWQTAIGSRSFREPVQRDRGGITIKLPTLPAPPKK